MKREIPKYEIAEPLYQLVRDEVNEEDEVLDIGSGLGNPVRGLQCKKLVGVDIYDGYKDITEDIFDEMIYIDCTKLSLMPKSYDVVIALDLLEHLDYEEAVKLVEKMETWARKRVLIFTPIGFLKQGLDAEGKDVWGYPNEANNHKCGFQIDFFIKRGYKIIKYPGDHEHGQNYDSMYCVKVLK